MNGSKRLLILSSLFTALTAVGARIKVPLPFVAFTLQDFFVVLSGFLLGPLYGALSQITYLFLGLLGLPVFADGGGIAYVFKPSFGYLVGFPFASLVAGLVVHRRVAFANALPAVHWGRLVSANFVALLAIFIPGLLYLWFALNFIVDKTVSFATAFNMGFVAFLPGSLVKMAALIWLYRVLQSRLAAFAPPATVTLPHPAAKLSSKG